MEKKKYQEILSYIWSLKERAEKLREESNSWEVRPNIGKRISEIDAHSEFLGKIIKIASNPELTEKKKKQLIPLTKDRLTSLKTHFLSVHSLSQKNLSGVWSKKIESVERELEERLAVYEKIAPLLFQKSQKEKSGT